MLDSRLYRVAFVPVLLALLVAAFSLQDRPRPIGTSLAPDAFEGARAAVTLRDLAAAAPSRRAGSAGDERLARLTAAELRVLGPGTVEVHPYRGATIDGMRQLVDVVATRPGGPGPGIVVVAHRDAAGDGAQAELSGTAALIELARIVSDGRLRRTITFISTSGGSGGFAGAREEARRLGARPDAVLVLGDLAGTPVRRPFVVGYSDGRGQAPVQLRRTVEAAVRTETGIDPGGPRAVSQWLRLAVPVTVAEQGAFARAGDPAVLLSVGGERAPAAGTQVSQGRLQHFGRAALRALYALDNGPDIAATPRDDLVIRGKVLPGWSVRLLVGALLLPPLLVAVDALARLRRRRESVGTWAVWTLAGGVPFVLTCLFAVLLAWLGLITAPRGPTPAAALSLGTGGAITLAAMAGVLALTWGVVRPALLGQGASRRPDQPGAPVGVITVTAGVCVLLWVVNPYAAALAVPALHLWLWAMAPQLRVPRVGALAMVAVALVPALVVGVADARAFGLGPLHSVWFWTQLVAGRHVPPLAWGLWSLLCGCGCAAALVVLRRPSAAATAPVDVTVRGPITYAGPGSLGGTESALRR